MTHFSRFATVTLTTTLRVSGGVCGLRGDHQHESAGGGTGWYCRLQGIQGIYSDGILNDCRWCCLIWYSSTPCGGLCLSYLLISSFSIHVLTLSSIGHELAVSLVVQRYGGRLHPGSDSHYLVGHPMRQLAPFCPHFIMYAAALPGRHCPAFYCSCSLQPAVRCLNRLKSMLRRDTRERRTCREGCEANRERQNSWKHVHPRRLQSPALPRILEPSLKCKSSLLLPVTTH